MKSSTVKEPTSSARLSAKQDVFPNGQCGEKAKFLVDSTDTFSASVVGVAEGKGLALPLKASGVRSNHSSQDSDEGALARPILAYQRQHLVRSAFDGHTAQGRDPGVVLGERLAHEDDFSVGHGSSRQ